MSTACSQEAMRPLHRNLRHSDAATRLCAGIASGGTPGHTTDTFETIMGRPGTSFQDYLRKLG